MSSLFAVDASLRRKIVLGYGAVAMLIVAATGVMLLALMSVERQIALREHSSELFDTMLEIRRYERNYFLHRQRADREEGVRFVALARTQLNTPGRELDVLAASRIEELRGLLEDYRQRLDDYAAMAARPEGLAAPEARVRESGKRLVDIAEAINRDATQRVGSSLASVRQVLFVAIALMAAAILVFGRAMARRVIRPLQQVEARVDAVARDKSSRLASPSGDSEIRAITAAINHLLDELELRQRHLLRAEKLASLGTMLSGVAHELNNPLTNISTSCQILLEGGDEATRERFLTQIDTQTLRAQQIVAALLDFARDRPQLSEPVAVAGLIAEALASVRSERSLPVVEVAVDAALAVLGNPQRLRQVFINLLRNAADASPPEGLIIVTARCRQVDPATGMAADAVFAGCRARGDVVDIAIADQGAGVAPEIAARIFDPFFTTKDVGRGMGLGLFVAHEIVTEHGGCIALANAGGAVFHLRLPAAGGMP